MSDPEFPELPKIPDEVWAELARQQRMMNALGGAFVDLQFIPMDAGRFEQRCQELARWVIAHPKEKLEISAINPATAERAFNRVKEILKEMSKP